MNYIFITSKYSIAIVLIIFKLAHIGHIIDCFKHTKTISISIWWNLAPIEFMLKHIFCDKNISSLVYFLKNKISIIVLKYWRTIFVLINIWSISVMFISLVIIYSDNSIYCAFIDRIEFRLKKKSCIFSVSDLQISTRLHRKSVVRKLRLFNLNSQYFFKKFVSRTRSFMAECQRESIFESHIVGFIYHLLH